MARAPQYRSSVGIPASAPAPLIDIRSVGAGSAGIQKIAADIGDDAAAIATRREVARQQAHLVGLEAEAARQLNAIELDFAQDTDFATAQSRYLAQADLAIDLILDPIEDDTVAALARREAEKLRDAKAVAIAKAANTREVGANRATLDVTTDEAVRFAATARTDIERQFHVGRALSAIRGAASAGWIDPTDAVKREKTFLGKLDEADARAMITADPGEAVEALADPARFAAMDPVQRTRLLDTATSRWEADRAERVRQAEKRDREAERAQTALADETAKEGWALAGAGNLTEVWLSENFETLSKPDYRALSAALRSPEPAADDPDALIDLNTRLTMEDVASDAARYLRQGRIKTATYQQLVERNRDYLGANAPPPWFTAERSRLGQALDPGQLVSGAARQVLGIAQTEAVAEFDAWRRANPEASSVAGAEEARAIRERFQAVNFAQIRNTLGLPRYTDLGRGDLTVQAVDAAERRALAEFEAQRLSQEQLQRELRKLADWRAILAQPAAAPRRPSEPNAARPR